MSSKPPQAGVGLDLLSVHGSWGVASTPPFYQLWTFLYIHQIIQASVCVQHPILLATRTKYQSRNSANGLNLLPL